MMITIVLYKAFFISVQAFFSLSDYLSSVYPLYLFL